MTDVHYALAIDLGAGGPKRTLVSNRGEIVCHTNEETPVSFLPDGGVKHDPRQCWDFHVLRHPQIRLRR